MDISLRLEEDKIYGLLGRNGAGKTTLLSIISNQIKKSSGEVKIDGEEVFENSKITEHICIIREKGIGIEDIKVREILERAKLLYKDWDEEYKKYLVNEFNLDVKKKYNKLSRGNQTIVGLIIGLASRSRLTIFDEPSLGLDAAYRYRFYNLLLEDMEKNPRTIIISTHLIDEVANLFEEVIILKDKKVYVKEEVSKLMERAYFLSGRAENILPIVEGMNIIHRDEFGEKLILSIFDDLSMEDRSRLKENDVDIATIPLQKLFIYLTEDFSKGEYIYMERTKIAIRYQWSNSKKDIL